MYKIHKYPFRGDFYHDFNTVLTYTPKARVVSVESESVNFPDAALPRHGPEGRNDSSVRNSQDDLLSFKACDDEFRFSVIASDTTTT